MATEDADKKAQKARSSRYGIAVREDGNVTKPSKWAGLSDSSWGDPVNYKYPVPDRAHAVNAKARFTQQKGRYDSKSRGVVKGRINRLAAKFGVDPLED